MKKVFALALSILFAFNVTSPAAAIALRATNSVNVTIQSNSFASVGTPLSMEVGELVTINCTFAPRTADVDFGLLSPQNEFAYFPGENREV